MDMGWWGPQAGTSDMSVLGAKESESGVFYCPAQQLACQHLFFWQLQFIVVTSSAHFFAGVPKRCDL